MESQYGYRTDPVTGMELVGARYYDPQSGRFLTRDPAGYFGGMNLYEYAGDSPTGSIDPSGLFSVQDAWNWYMNGEGGLGPWANKWLVGGAAANFGNTFGEYDSGCASALDVAVSGASLAGQMATFVIPGGEEAKGAELVGKGAEDVIAAEAGPSLTRVGRWMSQAEHDAMATEGRVQPTLDGLDLKSVTVPPNPSAFGNAVPGSVFAEFDVPTSQLAQGGRAGWGLVWGPNSILGRLAASSGFPAGSMPDALNIEITAGL